MKYLRSIIRLTLFFTSTFGLYFAWFIGNIFIPNKEFWRQIIFRVWAKSFIKIAGIKVFVKGRIPRPPFFLVSNHLSYVDIPVIRSVLETVFVAKGEIKNSFLGKRIVGDMGNIFVNRLIKRDIPRAGKQVLEALERGEGVVIFPEGTTSNGEKVLEFKSSFFEFATTADLPVFYATISYEVPKGFTPANESICWWREESTFLGHIWNLFQISAFEAFITFGEKPITADNRKEMARKLHEAVSKDFIPVS